MKKTLALAVFVLALAGFAKAEGVSVGDKTVSAYAGVSIPTAKYSIPSDDADVSDIKAAYGKLGAAYGVQAFYQASERLAAGLEFSGANYGTKSEDGGKFSIDRYGIFAAAKAYVNPSEALRYYIPVGLGVNRLKQKASSADSDPSDADDDSTSIHDYSTRLAAYLGIGAEYDVQDNLAVGAEVRYDLFGADKNFGNKSVLQAASVLLKVSYKI
jgi:opacity protein-like surface antigen